MVLISKLHSISSHLSYSNITQQIEGLPVGAASLPLFWAPPTASFNDSRGATEAVGGTEEAGVCIFI